MGSLCTQTCGLGRCTPDLGYLYYHLTRAIGPVNSTDSEREGFRKYYIGEMAFNYGFMSRNTQSGGTLPVPYKVATPNGLPPGAMVTITGGVKSGADRITINLRNGPNMLLHINPRFSDDAIVRNSMLDGSWGPEEKFGGMPLRRGQPFGCLILAHADKYMIAFNGQHFTEYQFRSRNSVTHVEVTGDVDLNKVEVAGNPMMPMPNDPGFPAPGLLPSGGRFPASELSFLAPAPSSQESIIYSAEVPFVAKLAGGMHPGRSLTLSCIPRHSPDQIRIDLQKDRAGDEIALHFNIRFHVGEHRKIICLNNFKHGHWGKEDRYSKFPFEAKVGFDLVIRSDPRAFTFFVNGEQFGTFQHRELDLASINHLHVQGALKITRVAF